MIKDMDSCTTNVTTKIIMLLFTQADSKVILGGREEREGKVDSNRLYFILPTTGKKKLSFIIHFVSELKWLLFFKEKYFTSFNLI